MRSALQSTELGPHKKVARWAYSLMCKHELGPKSAWLFVPHPDEGVFKVQELVTIIAHEEAPYERVKREYTPAMLDEDGWNAFCEKTLKKFLDRKKSKPEHTNPAQKEATDKILRQIREGSFTPWDEKALNIALNKTEREKLRIELFSSRLKFGSDIGVVSHHSEGECIWCIDATCNMHDESYLANLTPQHRHSHCFRSEILVPLPMYKFDGSNGEEIQPEHKPKEPVPVLALYSPAEAEFDKVDLYRLGPYLEMLAFFWALYRNSKNDTPSS